MMDDENSCSPGSILADTTRRPDIKGIVNHRDHRAPPEEAAGSTASLLQWSSVSIQLGHHSRNSGANYPTRAPPATQGPLNRAFSYLM